MNQLKQIILGFDTETHIRACLSTHLCVQVINIIWVYTLPALALFYLFNQQQTGLGKLCSVGPIWTTAYFCMAPTICMVFSDKHLLSNVWTSIKWNVIPGKKKKNSIFSHQYSCNTKKSTQIVIIFWILSAKIVETIFKSFTLII